MGKFNLDELCLGAVNIVTDNDLLLTGNIIKVRNKHDHDEENDEDEETVFIRLTRNLEIIPGAAIAPVPNPYYLAGDTVAINVDTIVTISPSHF